MEGIGIDIVEVERFEKYHGELDGAFCKKVFTDDERKYLQEKNTLTIAGFFAAKEAVAKALGTGFSGFFPNEIEVRHNELCSPYIVLHKNAKKLANDAKILVSIAHSKTTAVAVAQVVCFRGG